MNPGARLTGRGLVAILAASLAPASASAGCKVFSYDDVEESTWLSIDHKSNCDRRTWLTAAPSPSTVPPPASPTRAPADPRSRGPA